MKLITCPHCKYKHLITSKVMRDTVAVMPCPACHDLMVLFNNKVVGLKRDIMTRGTFEERRNHIGDVVMQYLDPGMFRILDDAAARADGAALHDDEEAELLEFEENEAPGDPRRGRPISQHEIDRFVRVELQRIDEASYFRKHFDS